MAVTKTATKHLSAQQARQQRPQATAASERKSASSEVPGQKSARVEEEAMLEERQAMDEERRSFMEERRTMEEERTDLNQALQASREREDALALLLDSLGHSSITLGSLDWSSDAAKALLSEEADALERVDACLDKVRANSGCMRELIAEQEELQRSLKGIAAA